MQHLQSFAVVLERLIPAPPGRDRLDKMDLDPFGWAGVPVVGSHPLVRVTRFVEQPRDRLVGRRSPSDRGRPVSASPRAVQMAAQVAVERPAAAGTAGDDDARMAGLSRDPRSSRRRRFRSSQARRPRRGDDFRRARVMLQRSYRRCFHIAHAGSRPSPYPSCSPWFGLAAQ